MNIIRNMPYEGSEEKDIDISGDEMSKIVEIEYIETNYADSLGEKPTRIAEDYLSGEIGKANKAAPLDYLTNVPDIWEEGIRNAHLQENENLAGNEYFTKKFVEKEFIPKVLGKMEEENKIKYVPIEEKEKTGKVFERNGERFSIGVKPEGLKESSITDS